MYLISLGKYYSLIRLVCIPDAGATGDDDFNDIFVFLEQLANDLSNRTTSIAFSGVAAHDVSDRWLALFLSGVLGRFVSPPKSVWLIEKSSACQDELKLLHSFQHNPAIYTSLDDQPCVFSDIMQFWRPELREIIEGLTNSPHLSVECLATLLMERRAVRLTGNCVVHGRFCRLKACARHSSGSVCTPYSTQGSQLSLNDVSVLYLLCWFLSCLNFNKIVFYLFITYLIGPTDDR